MTILEGLNSKVLWRSMPPDPFSWYALHSMKVLLCTCPTINISWLRHCSAYAYVPEHLLCEGDLQCIVVHPKVPGLALYLLHWLLWSQRQTHRQRPAGPHWLCQCSSVSRYAMCWQWALHRPQSDERELEWQWSLRDWGDQGRVVSHVPAVFFSSTWENYDWFTRLGKVSWRRTLLSLKIYAYDSSTKHQNHG